MMHIIVLKRNGDLADSLRMRSQRGIALAMSLTFLLILTLLAVLSMNTGTLQHKMTGNTRDQDIAFQSAESALRFGERTLSEARTAAVTTKAPPPCLGAANNIWCFGTVNWSVESWWNNNSVPYMGDGTKQIVEAAADPRMVIETLGPNEGIEDDPCRVTLTVPRTQGLQDFKCYRTTARGVGVSGVSESVVESFFKILTAK
jgi:type IV pilus assembly protein PilX